MDCSFLLRYLFVTVAGGRWRCFCCCFLSEYFHMKMLKHKGNKINLIYKTQSASVDDKTAQYLDIHEYICSQCIPARVYTEEW